MINHVIHFTTQLNIRPNVDQYKAPNQSYTVKLGNKERFDKEQIGIKEPFPVTNLPFTS